MNSATNNETANTATLKDTNMKPDNEPNNHGGDIKTSDIEDDTSDTASSSDTDTELPTEQRFSTSNDEETDEGRRLRLRIRLLEEQKRDDDRLRERIHDMENELAMSVARSNLLLQEVELRVLAGNMLLAQNNDQQNGDTATIATPVSRCSSVEGMENLKEKGDNM